MVGNYIEIINENNIIFIMGTVASKKVPSADAFQTFNYQVNTEKYSKPSKHINHKTKEHLSYDTETWLKHVAPDIMYKRQTELNKIYFSELRKNMLVPCDNSKWLKSVEISKANINMDVQEISRSFENDHYSHMGFIQYLAIAWGDEKGIILRPDMFHHLISCEIAKDIINHPENYRKLYTKSKEKKTIMFVMPPDGSDADFIKQLDSMLNTEVLHKEFKKLITDVKFESQPENYEMVKRICFANSATPYYNYVRSKCGFPSISISNVLDDWIKLYEFIVKMKKIISVECNRELIVTYLGKCQKHIHQIIKKFTDNKGLKKILQNIFFIEDETICMSGHDIDYYIQGWIKDFYVEQKSNILEYSIHLPYIPYYHDGVGNFCIVSGLISSKIKKEVLEPEYGNIKLKVNNQEIFNTLQN